MAQITFNPTGYYETHVNADHISALAAGCGFKTQDVQDVIEADNAQRRDQAAQNLNEDLGAHHTTETDMDYDLARFEPDPNDELTSDED